MTRPPIRTLIVDDSAVARQALTALLQEDPAIEVLGAVPDPYAAVARMERAAPDVLVLDLQMPRMDGLSFLRRIMAQHPLPVVICSSYGPSGSRLALEALAVGAVEVVDKPRLGPDAQASGVRLRDAVKAAAVARFLERLPARRPRVEAAPAPPSEVVVAVGTSTGGPEALQAVVPRLPADAPAVLVVQHMPAGFTGALARHLDELSAVQVREARGGEALRRGQVLVAPGDRHLLLGRARGEWVARVQEGALVRRHRPSVDVLFESVAAVAGPRAVGVVLTGMGDDGAAGLVALRQAGARTLAQDEASSVVYGMPREAVRRGGTDAAVPIDVMAERILAEARQAGRRRVD